LNNVLVSLVQLETSILYTEKVNVETRRLC